MKCNSKKLHFIYLNFKKSKSKAHQQPIHNGDEVRREPDSTLVLVQVTGLVAQVQCLDSKSMAFAFVVHFAELVHCQSALQLRFRNGDTVARVPDSKLVSQKLKQLEMCSKVLELPHFLLQKLKLPNHFQQLPNHFSELQKLFHSSLLCHTNIKVQRLL